MPTYYKALFQLLTETELEIFFGPSESNSIAPTNKTVPQSLKKLGGTKNP